MGHHCNVFFFFLTHDKNEQTRFEPGLVIYDASMSNISTTTIHIVHIVHSMNVAGLDVFSSTTCYSSCPSESSSYSVSRPVLGLCRVLHFLPDLKLHFPSGLPQIELQWVVKWRVRLHKREASEPFNSWLESNQVLALRGWTNPDTRSPPKTNYFNR